MTDLRLSLHTEKFKLRLVTEMQLKASIHRIESGVWYRIIPVDGDVCDDLSSAIGETWENMLPVLSTL